MCSPKEALVQAPSLRAESRGFVAPWVSSGGFPRSRAQFGAQFVACKYKYLRPGKVNAWVGNSELNGSWFVTPTRKMVVERIGV